MLVADWIYELWEGCSHTGHDCFFYFEDWLGMLSTGILQHVKHKSALINGLIWYFGCWKRELICG